MLFKMAMTLNGTVSGGIISGEESRRFVHGIRDRLDLLVVGGQTVRTDRPALDARMVDGKASDVLIISQADDFDKTIPLFGVQNRNVEIQKGFEGLDGKGFVMIEGGYKMMDACRDIVDWYLFFVAPKICGGQRDGNLDDINFSIIRQGLSGRDSTIWAKPQRS